ncbi:uncharacterized protein LOC143418891 [Maylandia zebra]|uniref:uncharacterized protein LOC143418891 n=1 Tax=Maylandia zebra TaxID=106582 RepID=UPI00403D4FF0
MSKESAESEDRANNREQCLPDQRQPEEQDDLQYTSIHFSNNQADPLYSNIRAAQPHRHMQEQEVTEYTAVRFNRGSAAKRHRSQEKGESGLAPVARLGPFRGVRGPLASGRGAWSSLAQLAAGRAHRHITATPSGFCSVAAG